MTAAASPRARAVALLSGAQWQRAPYRGMPPWPQGEARPATHLPRPPLFEVASSSELGAEPLPAIVERIEWTSRATGGPLGLWRQGNVGWLVWARRPLSLPSLHDALAEGAVGGDALALAALQGGSAMGAAPWAFGETAIAPVEPPRGFALADTIYPVVGTPGEARVWLEAGARLLQLRWKGQIDEEFRREVRSLAVLAGSTGCQLVVNDHLDVALESGAPLVHLGFEDTAAAAFSEWCWPTGDGQGRCGPGVGLSTHSPLELLAALALGPHYVALGPIWATVTKVMRWQEQTVAALQRYRAWLPPSLPLVAIGGIELSRVPEARRHGAQAVAAVRPFARPAAPREVLQAWRDAWSAP